MQMSLLRLDSVSIRESGKQTLAYLNSTFNTSEINPAVLYL